MYFRRYIYTLISKRDKLILLLYIVILLDTITLESLLQLFKLFLKKKYLIKSSINRTINLYILYFISLV
jgi:hypothetical protein